MFKESLCDEQGQLSSPRVQSFVCTIVGVIVSLAGLVMVAYGVKNVAAYVGAVLGATFGKGASDLWAAQLKSGKVLAAQAAQPAQPAQAAAKASNNSEV